MGSHDEPTLAEIESSDPKLSRLHTAISSLLAIHQESVPYHGWPHVQFVATHGYRIARTVGADALLVCAAGLVHDLNYLVAPGSRPSAGAELMQREMLAAGYSGSECDQAVAIVIEADLQERGMTLGLEAQCLSDADSLFKVLPTTPILLAREYLRENAVSLSELASSIIEEQGSRLGLGYFFYTDVARTKYGALAVSSIEFWTSVANLLQDDEMSYLADDILRSVSKSR